MTFHVWIFAVGLSAFLGVAAFLMVTDIAHWPRKRAGGFPVEQPRKDA